MKLNKALAGVCGLLLSTQAFGFIAFQAGAGYDQLTLTDSDTDTKFSGPELSARVQLDPIPLIPIGAGLKVWVPTLAKDSASMTGLGADLDLSVWSPVALIGLKPYGRLGYTVYGKAALKDEITFDVAGTSTTAEFTQAYDVSGTHLAVGAYHSLLPLVRLMFEVGLRDMTFKPTKLTYSGAGTMTMSDDNLKAKATTIMVGVDVGF